MEAGCGLSSPQADPSQNTASPTDRRRSGRVSRKPELFSQSYRDTRTVGGTKRKRVNDKADEAIGEGEEGTSESESDGAADDEPDEEEVREQLQKQKHTASNLATKKLATSKLKTKSRPPRSTKRMKAGNGISGQLVLRPAANDKVRRAKAHKVRPSLVAGGTGLYAEIFGKSDNASTVAAKWLTQYQQDQTAAMRDLVNFILRCTGTSLQIEDSDITDVDHAPDRIEDIQNQYQEQGISEYPLISKTKTFRAFQPLLEEFVAALIQTLHHSSALYDDANLFENIQIWIASMSTADFRPFRHTATLISLTILNTLCDIAREVTTSTSTSRKQLGSEKRKKSVNKNRIDSIRSAIEEGEKKIETIDELLQDGINTVFIHRYRDVDPRVRCECMIALGRWIRAYREFFLEGQYLRYLGWMLSDTAAQTRSVVVHQLLSVYRNKDNIAGLRSFTERFCRRMVEMAARDADVGVRTLAVELLDLIRDAGLIEPNDIDVVGRLIFDSEPKIRKAAGHFFVANIQDMVDSIAEGATDDMNHLFGDEHQSDEHEGSFTSPKRSWVKFKCLADVLQAYNTQGDEGKLLQPAVALRDMLPGATVDSRFVLATEAIYPHLPELTQWQSLAGYLLYDHSQIAEASADDTAGVVRNLYKMQEGQEAILLDVLYCVVKHRIFDISQSDIDRRGRRVKSLSDKILELQEKMAHDLSLTIPQLLSKFGAVPEAASAVLRLSHLIDLDKMQDLQKNSAAYSSLLNDINKQFLTHSDQDVLAEASIAFLHAKSSEDVREIQENKIQELWDSMVDALGVLSQRKDFREDGPLSADTVSELASMLLRISNLASVTDCVHMLEVTPPLRSQKKIRSLEAPYDIFFRIIKRGLHGSIANPEVGLVTSSMKILLFYFMWKVQALRKASGDGEAMLNTSSLEGLKKNRHAFAEALCGIMRLRSGLDEMRYTAATTLLDLQTLFGVLRYVGQPVDDEGDTTNQIRSLVHEIDPDTQAVIMKIHGTAERIYAKKIGRTLELDEDEAPMSESEDGELSDSESYDGGRLDGSERVQPMIIAEQRLCELTGKIILAIIGRVLDASGPERGKLKQRLSKNKSRLGSNYREILVFLDGAKSKPRSKGKQAASGNDNDGMPTSQKHVNHGSAERIDGDNEVEDIEDDFSRIEGNGEEDLPSRGFGGENDIDDNDGRSNHQGLELAEDEIMDD